MGVAPFRRKKEKPFQKLDIERDLPQYVLSQRRNACTIHDNLYKGHDADLKKIVRLVYILWVIYVTYFVFYRARKKPKYTNVKS